MTDTPLNLTCAHCGFTTLDPHEVITHMVETGHGLPADMRADLMDGSGGVTELAQMFAKLQDPETVAALEQSGEIRRLDPDDPDVPDVVREAYARIPPDDKGSC